MIKQLTHNAGVQRLVESHWYSADVQYTSGTANQEAAGVLGRPGRVEAERRCDGGRRPVSTRVCQEPAQQARGRALAARLGAAACTCAAPRPHTHSECLGGIAGQRHAPVRHWCGARLHQRLVPLAVSEGDGDTSMAARVRGYVQYSDRTGAARRCRHAVHGGARIQCCQRGYCGSGMPDVWCRYSTDSIAAVTHRQPPAASPASTRSRPLPHASQCASHFTPCCHPPGACVAGGSQREAVVEVSHGSTKQPRSHGQHGRAAQCDVTGDAAQRRARERDGIAESARPTSGKTQLPLADPSASNNGQNCATRRQPSQKRGRASARLQHGEQQLDPAA